MTRRWLPWLNLGVVLAFGIIGISSALDPFSYQPRIEVEDGHFTIRSALDRNVSIQTSGQGSVQINNADMARVLSGRTSTTISSLMSLNRRVAQLQQNYRSISGLSSQVSQLEDNVTDINQRLNTFVGSDQNRITNRGMRRYFAKVRDLEEKVNRLTQLLTENECTSNPCRNGGTCIDAYSGFVCNCPPNWEGPVCDIDVNECARFAGTGFGCQNGATCTNLQGSYRCDCPTNWYGVHCTEQHDDCSAASHTELCGHGTCVNENRVQPGQPKFRCICDAGWKKDPNSPACTVDEDECQGPTARCSLNPVVQCINYPGGYVCGPCPAGYSGNGMYCNDINECENQNGGCSMNPFVECYNIPGSRRCGPCPAGYFGNGQQCSLLSACSNNRGGCHPLATCIDNPAITGTYRECRCPPGYQGTGEGLNGCIPVSTQGITCDRNPCIHGTCQMIGTTYHCTCDTGYSGMNCDLEMDHCLSNPCQNAGLCVSNSRSFVCVCRQGFNGPLCESSGSVCGGRLNQDNGTLTYPEQSHESNTFQNCEWIISVNELKVINITFDRLELASYDCDTSFLQIYDGPNSNFRSLGRICAHHGSIDGTATTTHSQILVWFKSQTMQASTGFSMKWVAVDPICGGVINVTDYGSIKSPGYPGLYPANRNCSWLVQVPIGKRIQFSFATLMLEHHVNCSYDYVKVFDGARETDPEIGTYCSSETPPPLTTSGHLATVVFHSDYSVSDHGFNIAYSSVPGIPGCGNIYTSPQGSISSPNFPNVYQDNLMCEWIIRIHPDNRIKMTFTSFHLEQHSNCNFDYVEIYDGDSDNGNLIGRFCGTDVPPPRLSSTNQVYIRFKTDVSQRYPGFKLDYHTICGGIYTQLEGTLTSPYYPDYYPSHTTCIYELQLPQGFIVNMTVAEINIETHVDCRYDYLEIRDGDYENSTLLSTLCGEMYNRSVVSTYNRLYMKFETDGSIQSKGFLATYKAIDLGCGGVLTNPGTIDSPLNVNSYPHSVNCTWLLRAPENNVIQLTFTAFVLEEGTNCPFDFVVIKESEGQEIGKYCGTRKPPRITSLDNTLIIIFSTDNSVALDGFSASFEFLDASHACGGDFYHSSGIIKSPGYPRNYPHWANCVWVLHADNNKQITLNVTDFHLESHSNCKYDYLEIRNGGYESSPLIGKFCGDQIMTVIRSHGNALLLKFKSDSSQSAAGFQIKFDSFSDGCGGELTSPQGSIISPNYPQPYPLNAECQWIIRISEGSAVTLVITDIDIEEHATCGHDYLQIFDGDSERSKSLARLCNNQQNPGPITTKDNLALVRFRSDFSDAAGGFKLSYYTLCNLIHTKRRGAIESPNFPNPYPHNFNCSWTIKAPMGSNISISFSHLFIEDDTLCRFDYVEIQELRSDGPFTLGTYCGSLRPHGAIVTTTNTAIVKLITDRTNSGQGFRLEWNFVGCGGEIRNKPHGEITSPNYPLGYPISTECLWHIWYPPGHRVELQITDIDLEWGNCLYDFVKVYGGEDENSPLLMEACHVANNTKQIVSHGNEIFIHFMSDYTLTYRGFKATFQSLESGCGGIYTADEAFIMSPNFPENYNENDTCEYLIQVAKVNLVLLTFVDFGIPEAINCSHGYVAIYDGNSTSDPQLLRHCGPKPEQTFASTGNTMLVKLVADGVNIAKGFRAHYSTGCGSRLLADEGGEIHSMNYPHFSTKNTNCSWILYTDQPGEKVSLTVTHLHIESDSNCTYSSLIMKDGDMPDSPVIGQYCGLRTPPMIISRGNSLHVQQTRGIFRATYGILSSHCGGVFTSPEGTFSTPGYPNSYSMEMECVWTITGSLGTDVHLSFEVLDIEDSDYCNSDYVEVHENDAGGPLLGKFCGDHTGKQIRSAHKLWIKFRSDDVGTARGFIAHFNTESNTVANGTAGEITSPGYPFSYHQEKEYTWTIVAPSGTVVNVNFVELSIWTHSPTACHSSVVIYDGPDNTAPVVGEFCGYQIPDPVVSTGNVVTIVFYGKQYYPGTFHLQWNAASSSGIVHINSGSDCYQEYYLNTSLLATVTSPGYPEYYQNNLKCTYILRSPVGKHPVLTFDAMHIEEGNGRGDCPYDKLEVYHAPNPLVNEWVLNSTFCGVKRNISLESPTRIMMLRFETDHLVTAPGFRSSAVSKCGDSFFGPTGILKSSFIYPSNNDEETSEAFRCEWQITVPERKTIHLRFVNFDVQSDCTNTYIMLRNGGEPTSPVLGNGKYCGSDPPTITETSSNKVYVVVVYNPQSGRPPVFDLRWNTLSLGCGQHIYLNDDSPTAEITSPGYPSPPYPHTECEWIISAPSGKRIRIDFESQFQFSSRCYGDKDMEFLEIHDGGTHMAEVLTRYCYNDEPFSVLSTGNSMLVWYVTDIDQPNPGFKATVRIAQCGGTVAGYHGLISSPNYPDNYGSSTECEWFLKMLNSYHIVLHIEDFNTPPASNCSNTDYLEIRDMNANGELLGTYCGNSLDLPLTINVPGPEAYVKFKSNSAVTAKGFSMRMDGEWSEGCGSRIEDPSGTITSPRYPNALPAPRDCYWSIKAPPGRKVKLTFHEFNLPRDEATHECISYIRIYNASTRYHERDNTTKLCGSTVAEIESSSWVHIVLVSRGLSAGQGFSLAFSTDEESICGGVYAEPSGVISTPNFTTNSYVDCRWRVDIQENKTLALRFDRMDIPGVFANYCREGVLFLVGDQNYFIGRYCGNYTTQVLVTSSFASTTLRMIVKIERPSVGFRATYNVSNCGGMLDGTNATITSPGYPNSYPQNTDCRWIIRVPYGDEIKLTFEDFHLEDNCNKDYVRIKSGAHPDSPNVGFFCGAITPHPITSTTGMLSIEFHSDEFGTAAGFKVTTRDVHRGCGGTIHTLSGSFSSPNYPSRYDNNVECVWIIELLKGYKVGLNFTGRFEIEMDGSCSKDYLKLEDYETDVGWTETEKKCGAARPEPFTSQSNKLKVTFQTNERVNADGFNLLYYAVCGGNFTDNEGYVFSPKYPENYDINLKCSYTIGTRGQYVQVSFDDFSIEGHDTCIYDYVEFLEEIEYNRSLTSVGKYCGSIPPLVRTLNCPLTVKFQSDGSYNARGFKLHYEIINCGAVMTDESGYISVSLKQNRDFTCKWHIIAQPNKVIALRFTHFNMSVTYDCWYNYVQVRDGNETGPIIGSYCGGLPPIAKSSGNQLTVIYQSQQLEENKSFIAYYYNTYGVERGCGGLRNDTTGEIRSLDYDSDGFYDPNLYCVWTLVANVPDQVFKLTFESFDLQDAYNGSCLFDYVEIKEGAALIGRYCGSNIPSPIITASTRITITFHTSAEVNKVGFKISYLVTPSPCGRTSIVATMDPYTLRSPNYPNPYPVHLRCEWIITTNMSSSDSNSRYSSNRDPILMTLDDIDIPCDGDYLQIKSNTPHQMDPPLRICKDTHPVSLRLYSGASVIFHSDLKESVNRGFSASFKLDVCNVTYTSEYGIISLDQPAHSRSFQRCMFNITVEEGKTISLYVTSAWMSASNCDLNYIKVYDGLSTEDRLLTKFCEYDTMNSAFSTSNNMLIDTKFSGNYGFLSLTYMTSDKGLGCGGKIVAADGTITSPFYPQPYNKSDECVWQVVVPAYHTAAIYFRALQLNSTAGCDTNYLEIYEGLTTEMSARAVRYCGDDSPWNYESQGNELTFKLKTDSTNDRSGFYLRFLTQPYTPDTGVVYSGGRFER